MYIYIYLASFDRGVRSFFTIAKCMLFSYAIPAIACLPLNMEYLSCPHYFITYFTIVLLSVY